MAVKMDDLKDRWAKIEAELKKREVDLQDSLSKKEQELLELNIKTAEEKNKLEDSFKKELEKKESEKHELSVLLENLEKENSLNKEQLRNKNHEYEELKNKIDVKSEEVQNINEKMSSNDVRWQEKVKSLQAENAALEKKFFEYRNQPLNKISEETKDANIIKERHKWELKELQKKYDEEKNRILKDLIHEQSQKKIWQFISFILVLVILALLALRFFPQILRLLPI
ncbi:MAG: hypothetical protein PHE88_02890 [Elusimicrobia bacterium]|nr:hypothetical protein [Elusimicrobiota bacterium]